MTISESTERGFLLVNMDKRQFVDTDKLRGYPNSEGGYTKILRVSRGEVSGVFPFLVANRPARYPIMGLWLGDSIELVYSDSVRFMETYEGIAQGWRDISAEVADEYADFMDEPACDCSA